MKEPVVEGTPLSFKIILLGDSNVGKTTFVKQYVDHTFLERTKPTVSVDFVVKTCQVEEFVIKLHIFDTAGQERYKSLTRAYFKGTDAVLFLYDMSNKGSFLHLAQWVQYFERETDSREEVLVLVGTKKDLLSDNQGLRQEVIDKEEINHLIERHRFMFKFQSSAKDNYNIDVVFEELSRNLIYNKLNRKKSINPIKEEELSLLLKKDREHLLREEEKNNGCC